MTRVNSVTFSRQYYTFIIYITNKNCKTQHYNFSCYTYYLYEFILVTFLILFQFQNDVDVHCIG